MEDKRRKRKILLRKGIKLILVIIFVVIAQYYFNGNKSMGNELTSLVTKYNSACPIMISDDILMESVNSLPDNMVQYDFTLVHVQKESIDVKALHNNIEKEILAISKTNPSLQAFRDNRSTVVYVYRDQNQKKLFEITLTPEMY